MAEQLSRWQRFKHVFEKCRGPVESVEYIPPHGAEVHGDPMYAMQVLDEARLGVTLVHCRCRKCGDVFTNRELGDTREAHQ